MTMADWRLQTAGWGAWLCVGLTLAACARIPPSKAPQPPPAAAAQPAPGTVPPGVMNPPDVLNLIPLPATVEPRATPPFQIGAGTAIVVSTPDEHAARIARQLAQLIGRATGVVPKVLSAADSAPAIVLGLGPVESSGSYDLTIAQDGVRLTAPDPAGLFYGVQTLRQLLPYWSEYEAVMFQQPRPATLAPGTHLRAPAPPRRGCARAR